MVRISDVQSELHACCSLASLYATSASIPHFDYHPDRPSPKPHSRPPPPTQSGGRFDVRVFRNTLMHTQFPASEPRNGTLWPDTDASHVCTCCERVNSNINIRYPRRWWLACSAHTRRAHKYAPSARPTSVSARGGGRRRRTQCGRRLRIVYLY